MEVNQRIIIKELRKHGDMVSEICDRLRVENTNDVFTAETCPLLGELIRTTFRDVGAINKIVFPLSTRPPSLQQSANCVDPEGCEYYKRYAYDV